jgi:hypothetical protein
VWYRYCRLIIAGKEHIIKKIIGYFAEQGIGQVDLDSLQHNLNTLDKNNLLPARIEPRKDGVFFGDRLYEDFLEFQEIVDGLYGEYKLRQKTKEQKELQKNEIEFIPGKISVFPCNSVNDTIKYGVGTIWCVSRPGNGNYDSYRSSNQSTFYYVQDGTRRSSDPLSRVMVDMQANGIVKLTDINNTTGTIAEFGTDWKKYFEYLEKNGVDISQFVNKPMTQEEIEENNLIGRKIDNLDQFEKLSSEYKFKYIGRGHLLTTKQLNSIINLQSVHSNEVKNILINAYLNTGRCLPATQKIILFENNEGWRTTYIRRREIEIDQIRKHFENDDTKLRNYASDFDDNEITKTNNLYENPLKSTYIVVKNIEDFDFLLNKGVSLEQFNWSSVSQIPNLSEDFIREFADYVDWNKISEKQTLSEDFIREFKDKVYWKFISERFILSEDFIREFQDKMKNLWHIISRNQTLSEDFIREFQNKVKWYYISGRQKLSENFIREFKDKVNWDEISRYQRLSEDFIREFQDKVNWYNLKFNKSISGRQKLSENFIREFKDKVNWSAVSIYQTLSEDFIREFKDKVEWGLISEYQTLSGDFIREFQDKVDWYNLKFNKNISDETKRNLRAQGFPI